MVFTPRWQPSPSTRALTEWTFPALLVPNLLMQTNKSRKVPWGRQLIPDTGRSWQPALRKPKTPGLTRGFLCGRYWVRTSDLFGVNEARYHCANRPKTFPSITYRGQKPRTPSREKP